jgi:PIN domain nuclease of toxin-antitoxin system
MTAVPGSSAVLAVLPEEPGKDRVVPHLDDAVMSSVSWSEVVARMLRRQASVAQVGAAAALMAWRILPFGLEEAGLAGQLAPHRQALGLSLGAGAALPWRFCAMRRSLRRIGCGRGWTSAFPSR